MRKFPNIIVTGTPGVGKTTTVTTLLSLATANTTPIPLKHLSINDLVKTRSCHEGYDSALQTYIRGYPEAKLQENMDAEIFGVVADEAKEGWSEEDQVVELKSEVAEQVEENAERILDWIQRWKKDREEEEKE
ncbi:hypothetical protein DV738_g917, partial [Chaetothyriales sp. CBS 135597]